MKFKVTMKDPDTLHDAIEDAAREQVKAMDLPEDEAEQVIELRREKAQAACSRWFEYGEYVTLEIDTDTMLATVVERR